MKASAQLFWCSHLDHFIPHHWRTSSLRGCLHLERSNFSLYTPNPPNPLPILPGACACCWGRWAAPAWDVGRDQFGIIHFIYKQDKTEPCFWP